MKARATLVLLPKFREELRKPLGIVFRTSFKADVERLKDLLSREKPTKLIVVGDAATSFAESLGIDSSLYVVDHKVMRKPIEPVPVKVDRIVHLSNPAGTITKEAWLAIEESLKNDIKTQIVVDGEEDLLALPVALSAPDGSIILYGQPNEGIVAVKTTRKKKLELRGLVNKAFREVMR